MNLNQSKPMALWGRLFLAALLCLLALARTAQAEVGAPNGDWREEVEEFRVKTIAGDVRVQRDYVFEKWQVNARWNALKFEQDTLDGSVKRIDRNTALFERVGDAWVFNARALIRRQTVSVLPPGSGEGVAPASLDTTTPTASAGGGLPLQSAPGYRWQNRDGDWTDYDANGKLVAYGDRNDLRVWLEYGTGAEEGLLKKVRDHYGRTVLAYTWGNGQVTEIREVLPAGSTGTARVVSFAWDGTQLTRASDVLGNATQYAYANGRLVQETDPEGRIRKLDYLGNRVKRVTEPDGAQTDYVYDYDKLRQVFYQRITGPQVEAGRSVEERWHDSDGALIRRDLNGLTQESTLIDPAARTRKTTDARGLATTIQKDEFDNVVKTTFPDGSQTSAKWSLPLGQKLEETDELGVKTQYDYDAKGNLLRITEAVGLPEQRIIEYTRDSFGQTLTETRKGGAVSLPNGQTVTIPDATATWAYDNRGNPIQATDAEGNVTQTAYNTQGRPLQVTDANGKVWAYSWDGKGRLLSRTDPLKHGITFGYDKVGKPTSLTDAENHAAAYAYDAAGRVIRIADPLGNGKARQYDAAGRLTAQIDEAGNALKRLGYDLSGRLAQSTDGNGNATGYQYGDAGASPLPTKIAYPTFARVLTWDKRGRNTRIEDALDANNRYATVQDYDKKGSLTQITDRNGNPSQMAYDGLGRLVAVTDALGGVTKYAYDPRDNLLAVTDAKGNTTRYGYNRNNRKTAEIRPLGGTQSYGYDAAGNLTQYRDAKGNVIAFTYDDAGNRTGESHTPAGSGSPNRTIAYRYNGANVLTGYTDSQGSSASYTLDALGRRTAETVTYGSASFTSQTAYGATGKKSGQTWPDGSQASYTYDANQNLKDIVLTGGSVSVASQTWNAPTAQTWPGGISRSQSFDALMRLTGIQVKGPGQTTLMGYAYSFDAESNITQKATEHGTYGYGYDKLYRLTSASNPSPLTNEAYTYDAVGNRLTDSRTNGFVGTNTWTYNADNQLTQHFNQQGQAVTDSYDANGSLVKKASSSSDPKDNQQFVYDAQNRLTEVRDAAGNQVATYQYDPFGRRIRKTVYRDANNQPLSQAKTVWFLYGEEGLMAEVDGSGNITAQYGWKPDGTWGTDPVFLKATRTGGSSPENFYYQNDHLGTPQQLLDQSGAVAWQAKATAFGETQVMGGSQVENNLRFPGQYSDAETGVNQNWFRDYWSNGGRYPQIDPLGIIDDINAFVYSHENPLEFSDFSGLQALKISDILALLRDNNLSQLSSELLLCLIYKESTNDPSASNPAPGSTAWGLMGITEAVTTDLGLDHSDMHDAAKNIRAGTKYLNRRINWKRPFGSHGDIAEGLAKYGEGQKYARSILDCEKCLNAIKDPKGNSKCPSDDKPTMACLEATHGRR